MVVIRNKIWGETWNIERNDESMIEAMFSKFLIGTNSGTLWVLSNIAFETTEQSKQTMAQPPCIGQVDHGRDRLILRAQLVVRTLKSRQQIHPTAMTKR